jgi:hypothetical protein
MATKNMSELTSNQFYGGINRRHDKRARLLTRLGFKFDTEKFGWYNPRRSHLRNNFRIPPSLLQHAHNRAFYETLATLAR